MELALNFVVSYMDATNCKPKFDPTCAPGVNLMAYEKYTK